MGLSRLTNILITLIAVVFILSSMKNLLIPFVISLIIWFIIREIQTLISKITLGSWSLPRWLSMTLSFLLIFSVLGGVVNLLVANIQGISQVIPEYEKNLVEVRTMIDTAFGIDVMDKLREVSGDFDFAKLISSILNGLTAALGNTFLVIIYVIFLMLEESRFRPKLMAYYADAEREKKAMGIINQVDESLGKYISLKTVVSLVTGTLSYIILLFIGVDFAFFWAFLIFLLNFIPNIGSLVATLFPAIIAALQFGDLTPSLWVLVGVGSIQLLVGNFIEPRVMGDSLNVSSLVVILALSFWGALWGIVGMFLSVPITVMLVIIFAQFDSTKGVAILLSDKGNIVR